MLSIRGLRKTFALGKGQVNALAGVSLEVAETDFFTLLGPSGSGKSTALRCVAGLEHPEQGEIIIGEKCVFSSERGIRVPPDERPIGMVFQSYAIWPHMDVFHNVAFPLLYGSKGRRPPREDIRKSVREALAKVQMEEYETRPATQLSGGQQQRVALARALVRKPRLLLLDEPLSNLDAKLREEMRVELKDLTRALGITSFFVTHDQLEALAMSDWIGVIMDGVLVETGRHDEVYKKSYDRRVAAFLGIANTFDGRVIAVTPQARLDTVMGPLALGTPDGLAVDTAAAIAVRPEAIMCSRTPPASKINVFEGTVRRATFLGTFVDGDVQVGEQTLRVSFNPYESFAPGEHVYVHIPPTAAKSCVRRRSFRDRIGCSMDRFASTAYTLPDGPGSGASILMADERVERRLAAILAADMVGYSRLIGTDEEGTIARQKAYRAELIDPLIATHGGRIVKTMGDGLLVEFHSVVDAVKCAIALQQAMADRDDEAPPEARIQYRIGINLGDIVIDGGDILGDGVNVAARLEGLAPAGGICISGSAYQPGDEVAF